MGTPRSRIQPMTEVERARISRFIEQEFGVKMPEGKKSLLESRLGRRLATLGMTRYGEYFTFVTQDPDGRDEFLQFADLVTTHETSFFREPSHFRYLADQAIPQFVDRLTGDPLRMLSAACSTGEEAYTMAMVADATFRRLAAPKNVEFDVEGVDLSEHAVAVATRAVYLTDRQRPIPEDFRSAYIMRSKKPKEPRIRVVPELRSRVHFHPGNLLGALNLRHRHYDVIFCRNVLIYFDLDHQKRVLSSLLNVLKPRGWLFLGHSESMSRFQLPVKAVYQAVFQKT